MAGREYRIGELVLSETDLVRFFVILCLALCSTLISALAFARSIPYINYQLFFIPIIYAAYFYPRRGIYVAGVCGVVYQSVGYYYSFPNPVAMLGVTAEALFFVITAIIIAHFIDIIRTGEARYRSVFEHSQLGIVLFNRESFAIHQSNEKFATMLNYTPQEILASTFTELLFNQREVEHFLDRIDKQKETADFETRLANAGGVAC